MEERKKSTQFGNAMTTGKILIDEIEKQKMYLRRQAKNLEDDYGSEQYESTLTIFLKSFQRLRELQMALFAWEELLDDKEPS